MTETREARRVKFAAKNEARKAGRSNGTRAQQIEARRLRRALTGTPGAFGNYARADRADLIYGTTAER